MPASDSNPPGLKLRIWLKILGVMDEPRKLQQISDLPDNYAYRHSGRQNRKTLLDPGTCKTMGKSAYDQHCRSGTGGKRQRDRPVHASGKRR